MVSTCLPIRLPLEAVGKGDSTLNRLAGRDKVRFARAVFVADDSAQAQQIASNGPLVTSFLNSFKTLLGRSARGLSGLKSDASVVTQDIAIDYMKDNLWPDGNPHECTEQIWDLYHEADRFGTPLLVCHDLGEQ